MTRALAIGIALTLAMSFAPATAQEKKTGDAGTTTTGATSMTVKGTVKSAQADGIVVSGQDQAKLGTESGKDREWAFAINNKTTIRRGQETVMVTDLRVGDAVTVRYTEEGGKVVAQNVMVGIRQK